MQIDRRNKPGAGKSSLEKDQGRPTCRPAVIYFTCSIRHPTHTPLNLHHWKIQCGAKCSLCGNSRPTVAHNLNSCPVALEQGCYTWHHDCVLSTITSVLRCHIPTETTIYADLPILRATEQPPSTIPPFILVKPNLVLLHKGNNQATVIELTCSTNTKSNLATARSRKQNKAGGLQNSILRHGQPRLDS